MTRIYVLSLNCWDSPIELYFTNKSRANAFMKKYIPRNYGWRLDSYSLNPKKVNKIDEMWFANTKGGKALMEREEKEKG